MNLASELVRAGTHVLCIKVKEQSTSRFLHERRKSRKAIGKPPQQRQRERHLTKGLMSNKMDVHMRYSWYISLVAVLYKIKT